MRRVATKETIRFAAQRINLKMHYRLCTETQVPGNWPRNESKNSGPLALWTRRFRVRDIPIFVGFRFWSLG